MKRVQFFALLRAEPCFSGRRQKFPVADVSMKFVLFRHPHKVGHCMQNPAKVQNCARLLSEAFGAAFTADLAASGAGLVLGTGLGGVADSLENAQSVPFTDLPGFPGAAVALHAGRFIAGRLRGKPVLVQQGRVHLYEGHSPQDVCLATRIMGVLGVRRLVLTNAAGAVNPLFDAGDVMLISDHINFTGKSPLTGPNDDDLGPRFPDMSAAYDAEYKALARHAALETGLMLREGVYLSVPGPQLETPAETRAFRLLGADAVGMSTVLECIAARHMGMRVLGFSCLSNKNLPDCMDEAPLEEIIRVAGLAGQTLSRLLEVLIPRL